MSKAIQNVQKLREKWSARALFNIRGNGTDETTKILNAIDAARGEGVDLVFSRPETVYRYESPIVLTDGMRISGEGGSTNRWRSTITSVQFDYRGTGSAVTIIPEASAGIDSVQISNLQFLGTNASSGAHGLYLNSTATSSYIEGVLVDNSTFLNFPGNQILHSGVVFDVLYKYVTAMNPGRTALDCVKITNAAMADGPSQITFDSCWLAPYTATKWCIVADICQDLRLIGGTLAPYVLGTVGANGVQCNGGLTILGTHIEGTDPTNTDAIGVQYLGSNGGLIAPSGCSLFGQGVVIGDGTSAAARGYTIGGSIGNNNTADIVITSGGTRTGVIGEIGYANSTPTILDNRRDVDGVYEVVNIRGGVVSNSKVSVAPGTDTDPGLSFASASTRGFFDTTTGIGVATGGGQQAEFTGTDLRLRTKLLPGTPAGVVQTAAGLYGGTGVPSNADGANGDFYLRSDGGASTTIYQRRAGSWVGIV